VDVVRRVRRAGLGISPRPAPRHRHGHPRQPARCRRPTAPASAVVRPVGRPLCRRPACRQHRQIVRRGSARVVRLRNIDPVHHAQGGLDLSSLEVPSPSNLYNF